MTTVKWYVSYTGSSLIILDLPEAHRLSILIPELSIIQQYNELGHFILR